MWLVGMWAPSTRPTSLSHTPHRAPRARAIPTTDRLVVACKGLVADTLEEHVFHATKAVYDARSVWTG